MSIDVANAGDLLADIIDVLSVKNIKLVQNKRARIHDSLCTEKRQKQCSTMTVGLPLSYNALKKEHLRKERQVHEQIQSWSVKICSFLFWPRTSHSPSPLTHPFISRLLRKSSR